MADFNAGSIEGSVSLDLDPFAEGLRRARLQAEEFERKGITARVRTEGDTSGLPSDSSSTATVRVDDTEAKAKLAEDNALLDRIDHRRATAEVKVDTSQSSAALAALNSHIDKAVGAYNGAPGGEPGVGHGMMALIGLAMSLAPALGPATAAAGLFGAAGVAGFGGAAASAMLYAKVVAGALAPVMAAIKANKQLTGTAGQLETAVKGISSAWHGLIDKASPGILKMLVPIFQTLEQVIPKLLPLINAMSKGLSGAFAPIGHLLEGGQFEKFIHLLSSNAVKDLPQIGHILANGLSAAMRLFTALNPVIQAMLPVMVHISKIVNQWAGQKAPAFIDQLFATVKRYGPQTLTLLSNLFKTIGNIGKGLAPLVGPALTFLDAFTGALSKIDLTPLTKGVGQVLTALTPFVKVLGNIVNILLPPLGTLLGTIAQNFVGPLGKSLQSTLNPALKGLADMLNYAAPFLGQIVSSFADLVTPVGVGLVSKLIGGLVPIVHTLVGPLSRLVVALESFVDDGLKAISPAIGPVMGLLGQFAKVIAPVIDAFAWFLSHKAVADTILGIAAAIKGISMAMTVVETLSAFAGVLSTIMGLAAAEGVMAGIAAVSPALAAGIGMVGTAIDILLGPVGLIILAIAALGVGIYELVKHWKQVKEFFDKVGSAIKTGVMDALGWLKKHWDILAIIVAPFLIIPIEIAKHWSTVQTFLKKIPGWVEGVFHDAVHWLVNLGGDIISGLWNGIKSIWSHVTGWFGSVKGWILGAIGDAGSWLVSIGTNIIDGLWNGLQSAWGSVSGWLSDRANDIKGVFSKALSIFSPSRVMMKIGEYTMQGLHLGMKNTWGQTVQPFLQSSAKAVSGAFSGRAVSVPNVGALGAVGAAGAAATASYSLSSGMASMLSNQQQANASLKTSLDEWFGRLLTATSAEGRAERAELAKIVRAIITGTDALEKRLGGQHGPTPKQRHRRN